MSSDKRFKRKLYGKVVSNKSDKTIVVNIIRRFRHPKYKKYVHISKKYHAHDEANQCQPGDDVTIIESRPHSKLKKWELFKVNQTATQVAQ